MVLTLCVFSYLKSLRTSSVVLKVYFFALCFTLMCLSLVSHLIVEKYYYPYRVQYALFSAMLVFIYFGFQKFYKINPKIVSYCLLIFLMLATFLCYSQVLKLIVTPNKIEWEYVKEKVSQAIRDNKTRICIIAQQTK